MREGCQTDRRAAARLFGPGWLMLPPWNHAVHESDLVPCRCGGTLFWVARAGLNCMACLPPRRDDVVYGWVDLEKRRLRVNRGAG